MSKFFKGIAKVFKSIGKGIKKVFKKVVKSKIFKVVLIAVAVYFGGVALGLWGGAGAAGTGGLAAAGTGTATTTAGTGIAAASTAAAPTVAATTTGAGIATGAEVSAALVGTPTAAVSAGGGVGAGLATTGEIATALTATEAVAAPSFLSTLGTGAKAVGSFMKANPLITAMGMQGISAALAPDEMDLLKEQENIRQREFDAALNSRRENLTGFNTLPLLHQARGEFSSLRDRRLQGI